MPTKQATVTLPALTRVNGVEIVHIGERIPASTGPVTIDHKDLADIVAASRDPNAPAAVLKIGHHDARFDGEPAYGRLVNFRLSADGSAVLVDIAGVPARLAHIMPYAWPSRSIEMMRGEHMATIGLGQYRRVCTAVSLLGVALPAITRLEDIYTNTGLKEIHMDQPTPNIAALAGGLTMEDIAQKVRDKLQTLQAFLHDLVVEESGLAAIYETADYQLHQVPVMVDGTTVTLGEAQTVYRTYAPMERLGASPISVGGLSTMPTALDETIAKLESAVTTLTAAIMDKLEANTATMDEAVDDETTDPAEVETEEPAEDGNDVEAVKDEYEQTYDDLVAKLEDARRENEALAAANRVLTEENQRYSQVQAKQLHEQRDAVLLAAIRDGRITPAQREGYEAWAKVDPDTCAAHLAALVPSNPTEELGYAVAAEDVASPDKLLARSPWGDAN